MYTDPSDTGYGGYTVEMICMLLRVVGCQEQSSTWRELVAMLRVLDSIAHMLRNMRVHWLSKNAHSRGG